MSRVAKVVVTVALVAVRHARVEAGLVGLVGEHLDGQDQVATVKVGGAWCSRSESGANGLEDMSDSRKA